MVLPDVNVLVYAHREDAANHGAYRTWLEGVVYVDDLPAAKLAKRVPDEIGRAFGRADIKSALELAPIGSSGNLPRNFGKGPGTRAINLRASRTFMVRDRIRVRPSVDVFNVFNNTIFSFGSEFIDRDDSDFLIPRRTQRPRTVMLGLKVSF